MHVNQSNLTPLINALINDPGMVVRDGISTLADLTTAVKRLAQARVEVKGVLFNGQQMRISSSYGYKYGNYKQGAKQDN